MATAAIANVIQHGLPAGTTVGAYPVSNWQTNELPPSGAAKGSATNTGVVAADGSLSISGLADGTKYYLAASVSGTWKYLGFRTPPSSAPTLSTGAATEATLAGVLKADAAGGRTLKYAAISVASSGDNSVVAAVAAKKITVVAYVLVAAGAVTARWYSGAAGTALSGDMSMAALGSLVAAGGAGGAPLLQAGTNTALVLKLGGAVQVSGHLTYYEE